MKIAIGCDHIVTDIKDKMVTFLCEKGHEVIDCGTYDFERTHYPLFGRRVAELVISGEVQRGFVICGTGVGISVSATKIKGIRATLARDILTVQKAREHYDANVLGVGGRITGVGMLEEMFTVFLNTDFVPNEKMTKEIAFLNSLGDEKMPEEAVFSELLVKWNEGYYQD